MSSLSVLLSVFSNSPYRITPPLTYNYYYYNYDYNYSNYDFYYNYNSDCLCVSPHRKTPWTGRPQAWVRQYCHVPLVFTHDVNLKHFTLHCTHSLSTLFCHLFYSLIYIVSSLDLSVHRPIDHGECGDLLKDSLTIVKTIMSLEPNDIRFSMLALSSME